MHKRWVYVTLVIFFSSSLTTHAQAGGLLAIPAIAYGSQKVSEILKQAQDIANNILQNAGQETNHVLTDSAMKMDVEIANLNYLMGKRMDITFDRLEADEKNALLEFQRIIDEANAALQITVGALTDMDIDLNATLNRVPFIKKAPLSISRINGMYQIYHEGGEYQILIQGLGFGLRGFTESVDTEVFLNGTKLEGSNVTPNDKHQTLIRIPYQLLNPMYRDSDMKLVSLFVQLATSKKWSLSKEYFKFNLPILLLPKVSATLEVHALRKDPAWDVLPENTSYYTYEWSGAPNSDQLQSFVRSETYNMTKKAKTVFLALDHPWDGCRWCCTPAFTGLAQNPDQTYEIDHDLRKITFKAMCNGSKCNLRWGVTYQNLGSKDQWVDVEKKHAMVFGDRFSFDLPADATDWKVDGITYDRRPISCIKGNCDGIVQLVESTRIGDHERVTVRLRKP